MKEFLRGAVELERTDRGYLPHRLPAWARAQTPDPQLAMVEAQPSGVRLALRTTATVIELDTLPTKLVHAGFPARPEGMYDLLVDGELTTQLVARGGNTVTVDMSTGTSTFAAGPVVTLRFDDLPTGDKTVEIWLPHNERTELVALRPNAPATPAPSRLAAFLDDAATPAPADDRVVVAGGRAVWLHHGSSISQGSNAISPSAIWPALAAAQSGAELFNLGLSGGALLDPFTARTLRDLPADVISVKIGINLVNADLMRLRAFTPAVHGFLDTVREGHPDTPLLVVSPIFCPIHEDIPGPGAFDLAALREGRIAFQAVPEPAAAPADKPDGRLTLRLIRDELARIVEQRAAADPHLHYLNGLDLYGEPDHAELPLPDRLHPDPATHRRIAARFAKHLAPLIPDLG